MTQTDLEGNGAYVRLESKKPSNNSPIQATTPLNPARERDRAPLHLNASSHGGYLRFYGPVHGGRLRRRVPVGVGRLGARRHRRLLRFGLSGLRGTLDVLPVSFISLWGTTDTRGEEGGGVSALSDSAARRVRGHEEETEAISRHHFVSPPALQSRDTSVGGRNISESQQKVHQSASSVKYPAFLLVGRPRPRPRESCIFARGASRIQGEKQRVRTHTEGLRYLKTHTVKEHFC